jgi:hypothetical protein
MTRWLKRTALRAGVSEARIQQVKRWRAVQRAMIWRNKLAMARVHR